MSIGESQAPKKTGLMELILQSQGSQFVTYEVKSGFLLDCEILMLDRDLDIITKVDLADYITPEYALLTQRDSEDLEQHDSQHRVKLKKKFTQEDSSLVALKEAEKENRA